MYFSDEYKQLYKNIQSILYKQDQFLEKGLISINKRIEALKSLKEAIKYYESDIMTALKKGLGKVALKAIQQRLDLFIVQFHMQLKI